MSDNERALANRPSWVPATKPSMRGLSREEKALVKAAWLRMKRIEAAAILEASANEKTGALAKHTANTHQDTVLGITEITERGCESANERDQRTLRDYGQHLKKLAEQEFTANFTSGARQIRNIAQSPLTEEDGLGFWEKYIP